MVTRLRIIALAAAVALLGQLGTANAEVIGPLLKDGAFELGAQLRYVHRDYKEASGSPPQNNVFDDADGMLFFRCGVTSTATLSGEALVGNTKASDWEHDCGDARYYLVGAGLQALLSEFRGFMCTFGIHGTASFEFDRTENHVDREYQTAIGTILVEKRFTLYGQRIDLLAGPSYWYANEKEFRDWSFPVRSTAVDPWGGMAGITATLYTHYTVFGQVVYAGHAQPRFGLSYSF